MALRRRKTAVPPPARALTAATSAIPLGTGSSWETWKFGNSDWQVEAWRLYDVVGELHFLAGRIGDSIARARLYVTEVDDTGEETGEVTEERIARLAAIPLGTGAQRDDALKLAATDLAVGGECWLVGQGAAANPEATGGSWFVVTSSALGSAGGRITVRRPRQAGGGKITLTDGVDILLRCWRPHPNDPDQADAPTRSGIVPLREIELLTKREFSELDSRLTGAGVMFLPEGIDFPRREDDPLGIAGFMAYVQRAAAASMQDQGDARSMVPIMATVPTEMLEYLDKIKPINFWSDLSGEIAPMKVAAIARFASFSELPSEVLTGMGDLNHWTGWLVTEEGQRWISGYGAPILDALTRGFLQLALKTMGVQNPERYAYAFDYSRLAAKPNRLDDALKLRELNLISDEETVKAGAFDPEQMPSTEDRAVQIVIDAVKALPSLLGDRAVQKMLGLPEISTAAPAAIAPEPVEEPDDGNEGPPEDDGEGDGDTSEAQAITAALSARLALASAQPLPMPGVRAIFNASAKLMVFRALELAGGRLTTPAERRGRWSAVPRHELHAKVGPITPDKAEKVTEGAWNHIGSVAADLGVDPVDMERLLSGYVTELLTRGMAHHDDLLFAALDIANRGRGLVAA